MCTCPEDKKIPEDKILFVKNQRDRGKDEVSTSALTEFKEKKKKEKEQCVAINVYNEKILKKLFLGFRFFIVCIIMHTAKSEIIYTPFLLEVNLSFIT